MFSFEIPGRNSASFYQKYGINFVDIVVLAFSAIPPFVFGYLFIYQPVNPDIVREGRSLLFMVIGIILILLGIYILIFLKFLRSYFVELTEEGINIAGKETIPWNNITKVDFGSKRKGPESSRKWIEVYYKDRTFGSIKARVLAPTAPENNAFNALMVWYFESFLEDSINLNNINGIYNAILERVEKY
ncbi:hypothetical protein ACFL7D_07810 [candidate division KSB1 bacterium]